MANSNIPERMDPYGYEEDQPVKPSGTTRQKLARLQTGPWAPWVSAFSCAAAVVLILIVPSFRAMDTKVCQAAEVAIDAIAADAAPEAAGVLRQASISVREHQKEKAVELLEEIGMRDSTLASRTAPVIAILR